MNASLEQPVSVSGAPLPAQPRLGTTLPVQLTRFIGRSAELTRIRALLDRTRLLTLTGPGGSGKTRLALEMARGVEADVPGAVCWVELAALTDSSLVAQEVAATLRLVEEPGHTPLQALAEAFGERRAVLVLDNCEHLVEACAQLSDGLLRSCPNLTILATSREGLGIAGEIAWTVPPLSLPAPSATVTAGQMERSEAVTLFVERAQAVSPGFAITDANALTIARICRRLDGIPLALELAAARVRVLTPAQILVRLDDCFSLLTQHGRTTMPRHQTIRATIDWSYQLLLPHKRLLLQRLSIFAGGFTLEAAEQVCAGGDIDSQDVFDIVAALVERSLVVMREQDDSARYHLLETVRQFAAECLNAEEVHVMQQLARRHAEFFAAFAETAAPGLEVLEDPAAMTLVAAEHDNLRSALDWSLRNGEPSLALRISGGLWPYWLHGAHWSDGLELMARVLERAGPVQPTAEFGRALLGAGSLAYVLHDLRRAHDWIVAAEDVWQTLTNARYLALVHQNLAQIHMHLGEPELAVDHAQASERFARGCGSPGVLAFILATGGGFVHAFRGEADLADRFCAEAQEIALRIDYQWGILVASFSRAMTAWMNDDAAASALHARPCITAARRLSYPWFVPRVLLVGAVALHRSDPARAARLLAASAALQFSSRGGRLLPVEQPHFLRIVEAVRGVLDEATFAEAWRVGALLGLQDALEEADAGLGQAGNGNSAAKSDARLPAPAAPRNTSSPIVHAAVSVESAAPAELCVRALGPLQISRGGELLGTERWSYAKPRELLLYLLCNRSGATKEEIGQAIWPEATPSQVRNNLHVSLHYVRKVLGSSDWIVYTDERYRVDPARTVDFDLEVFESEADAILGDVAAVDDDRLRGALANYRGDFLGAEVFGVWHYEWRDRALGRYVALLALLAERCLDRQDYGEATQLYQQLIAREELREDFHRGFMQCLARTGARARALRHAEQLVQLLREELDAEPEPETAELCERLRRAESV
jgi:predicted ATPase/DNA-binding SARP family transcriptional activator